jgi:hypothetical protein
MITRRSAVWLLLVLLLAVPLFAQRKRAPSGPRAVAILEWTPQGLRLIPVSLLIDGQYYDATLYLANPVPMALDQDTVYEVQKSGSALGDFTVTLAGQLPNGSWVGQGKYESDVDRKKKADERAKAAAAVAKPVNPQDDRPVLRRSQPKSETPPVQAPAPASNPVPTQPATPAPAGGAQQNVVPPPSPVLSQTDDDANRPILKRGKPAEEQADKLGKDTLPHQVPPKSPAGLNKMQVAVSDASTSESHPYTWKWANPDEEKEFRDDADNLALSLVSNYRKRNGGPAPGKLEVVGFNAFDLAYNNEPQVILTARILPAPPAPARRAGAKASVPPPNTPSGFEYYVTLVATQDIYGQLQKMFSAVTDSKHLDAFPRYNLVDAVDADGDGNGDLLFRRTSDLSSSFVLYKVIGTRVEELLSVPEPKGY